MSIDWDLATKIAAPTIGVFVGVALNRLLERRPRLISWLGHTASVTLRSNPQQNPLTINTHSVVVRNTGRKPAAKVRLAHLFLPDFQVWPTIPYTVESTPGGGQDIVFPSLVPGEQVAITYLYFPPVVFSQINVSTRSADGFAKIVTVLPTPQLARWLQLLLWVLIVIGAGTLAYLAVKLLAWLST